MSPQVGYKTIESTSKESTTKLNDLADELKELNILKDISKKFNTLYDIVRYFENTWNDSVFDVFAKGNYYSIKLTASNPTLHRIVDKLTDAPAKDSYEFALLYAYGYNQFYEAEKLDIKSRNDKKKFKEFAAVVLNQPDLQNAIDKKLNYTIPKETTDISVLKKIIPTHEPLYNDGMEMGKRFNHIYDNFFVTLTLIKKNLRKDFMKKQAKTIAKNC
jgi:hypothetical protein